MAERGYIPTQDAARRIADAVRAYERGEGNDRRSAGAHLTRDKQPVRITSTTLDGGLYPAQLLRPDAAADPEDWEDVAEVRVQPLSGDLEVGRYWCVRIGRRDADGLAVFQPTGGSASAGTISVAGTDTTTLSYVTATDIHTIRFHPIGASGQEVTINSETAGVIDVDFGFAGSVNYGFVKGINWEDNSVDALDALRCFYGIHITGAVGSGNFVAFDDAITLTSETASFGDTYLYGCHDLASPFGASLFLKIGQHSDGSFHPAFVFGNTQNLETFEPWKLFVQSDTSTYAEGLTTTVSGLSFVCGWFTGGSISVDFSDLTGVSQAANVADLVDGTMGSADGTLVPITDPADAPASADALRDDLVANALAEIRDNFADVTAKINEILSALQAAGLMA